LKTRGWTLELEATTRQNNVLDPFVFNFTIPIFEDKRSTPRFGDNLDFGGNEVWTTFC
jgi:hypothetical protein